MMKRHCGGGVQPSLCKATMKMKLKLYAIAATSTRCIITDSVLQWRMQPKSIAPDASDSLKPVGRAGVTHRSGEAKNASTDARRSELFLKMMTQIDVMPHNSSIKSPSPPHNV
jgi:hypothetical protein